YLFTATGQANGVPGDFQETVDTNLQISVNFVFGTSFEMMFRAIANANLSSTGDSLLPGSSADSDFYSTIYWSGIDGVTVGGIPVTGYTLTAGSGTNWNQSFAPNAAVPEPGTLSITGLAVVGLFALRRFSSAS